MAEIETPYCPECDEAFDFPEPPPLDRRDFFRIAGGTTAAVALTGSAALGAAPTPAKKSKPAEDLIKELFGTLSEDQKKKLVYDFDHGKGPRSRPTRLGMFNAPIFNLRIGDVYTKAQVELIERIVKAMSNGDDGYRQISRGGTWDGSGAFERTGAVFFGEPKPGNKYAFVFAGHHLTIRADGDFEDGIAFGGPTYYGHSPNGWSRGNIFNYQTRSVVKLYQALDLKQQEKATQPERPRGVPREQYASVVFRAKAEDRPGLPAEDLSKDQRALVEEVMRSVLKPYRQEDVDEVMTIVKKNGGLEKIKLAFYTETHENTRTTKEQPWSFWRLEGPGFVWNFRVLPHVHTYVNISSKLA
jgi:hypothetical protein